MRTIFVPSPNVSEDHQTKNAKSLVNKNAAVHVEDNDARTKLVEIALDLIHNEARSSELSDNIAKLGKPDATEKIVKEVFKIIDN